MTNKVVAKLLEIFPDGNFDYDNGLITIVGAYTEQQSQAIAALATYTGEDFAVQQIEPVYQDLPVANHFPNGRAIEIGYDCMVMQRVKGVGKYGTTIEDADLSAIDLANHAQQEAADGLVYTSMLGEAIERDIAAAVAAMQAEVLAVAQDESKSDEMRLAIITELVKGTPLRCATMYVQQSQLEEYNRTNGNLLQLSRVRDSHVFKTPVKVIA